MRDPMTFEARLADAFGRYADAAPVAVDARAYSRAVVADVAARSPRGSILPWRTWSVSFRAALLLALLALTVIGATLIAGSLLREPRTPMSLGGTVEPTGSMLRAVWRPATAVLSDGSVLVVGTTPGLELDAERFDPAHGTFEAVAGLDGKGSVGTSVVIEALPGGAALVFVPRSGLSSGVTYGPYALRYDPASRRLLPVQGAVTDVPGWVNGPTLAAWPRTSLSDGRISWVEPDAPTGATPLSVTYDPASGVLAASSDGDRWPQSSSTDSVRLPDGRVLTVAGSSGERRQAAVLDPATGTEWPLDSPLVNGGTYSPLLLVDGRVLIVGTSTLIFDPLTGSFTELDVPSALSFGLRLPDGQVLLQGTASVPLGAPMQFDAWLFDPARDRFTRLVSGIQDSASWAMLPDGRVLMIEGASPDPGNVVPSRAWLVR